MSPRIASLQLIASPHIAGAETSLLRLVRAMIDAGHAVQVGVRSGSELARRLPDDGSLHRLPFRSYLDLPSVTQIRQLLERLQVPVVQTWASRATWLTRAPQGTVHVARLGGYYKLRYFRHADAWIVNTRGLRDWMVNKGFPPDRVEWINNFVPLAPPGHAPLLSRADHGVPADALLVISMGRFIDKKGFQDLIAAFARLPARIDDRPVHLMLIGDGSLLADLRAAAASLQERVHFTGWLDQPLPLLGLADVFVCPSRVEPLGNVVLEAWSQGLPVICTDTAGGTELIQDGDNGLLTPMRDGPRMAHAMERVLRDAELRGALAGHGRAYLHHRYSAQKTLDATLDFYRRMIRQSRVRRF